MKFLDKYGWPVERVKGRIFRNLIRILLNTRRIVSDKTWEEILTKRNKEVTDEVQCSPITQCWVKNTNNWCKTTWKDVISGHHKGQKIKLGEP